MEKIGAIGGAWAADYHSWWDRKRGRMTKEEMNEEVFTRVKTLEGMVT